MNKKTRNIIIAVAVLLVLVIGALVIYNANKPAAPFILNTAGK